MEMEQFCSKTRNFLWYVFVWVADTTDCFNAVRRKYEPDIKFFN